MGLDMYAYMATQSGQWDKYWGGNPDDGPTRPAEIAYWRKHPNLHGWMEQLWREKQYKTQPTDASEPVDPDSDVFNCVELELTWDDIDQLEHDLTQKLLPSTTGFFFGNDSDEYYLEQDLKFVRDARANLFLGLRIFYNSSW